MGAGCPFKQPRQRKGQFLPLIAQIANPQHIGGIGPDHIAIALLAPDQHRGLGHRHAQKVQLLGLRAQHHQILPRRRLIAIGIDQHQPRQPALHFGLQDYRPVLPGGRGKGQRALGLQAGNLAFQIGKVSAQIGQHLDP